MLGLGCGRLISERFQKTLMMACAVAVIFLGLTGAVKEMLALDGGGLALVGTNCMLASLIGGALIGEAINIEDRMEKFGIWLRRKTGSSGDTRFVDGFVTASVLYCVGAMAILGSIDAGIHHDYTILTSKAVIDGVFSISLAAAVGVGVAFSAVPVLIYEGAITLLAGLVAGYLTEPLITELSAVGGCIIVGIGLNMLKVTEKPLKVGNMLPAVFIPFLYLPLVQEISRLIR